MKSKKKKLISIMNDKALLVLFLLILSLSYVDACNAGYYYQWPYGCRLCGAGKLYLILIVNTTTLQPTLEGFVMGGY